MKPTTIFITYNPSVEIEQTLAIRLHTLGVASGFTMFLPDRYNSNTILLDESKLRISNSDYLVIFSTSVLSKIVRDEILFASNYIKDTSKIIVIYDKEKGKNLTGDISNHFTPFYLDKYNNRPDELLTKVLNSINGEQHVQNSSLTKKEAEKNSNAVGALLGIGLGLLLLGALASSSKK